LVMRQRALLPARQVQLPEVRGVRAAPDEDVARAGRIDAPAQRVRGLPGAEEPAVACIELEELGCGVAVDAHVGEDEVEARRAPVEGEATHRQRAGGD